MKSWAWSSSWTVQGCARGQRARIWQAFRVEDYRITNRGGKGVKTLSVTRNGQPRGHPWRHRRRRPDGHQQDGIIRTGPTSCGPWAVPHRVCASSTSGRTTKSRPCVAPRSPKRRSRWRWTASKAPWLLTERRSRWSRDRGGAPEDAPAPEGEEETEEVLKVWHGLC